MTPCSKCGQPPPSISNPSQGVWRVVCPNAICGQIGPVWIHPEGAARAWHFQQSPNEPYKP